MVSRLGFDVLAAFILAITAAIGAYLPMYLVQREKSSANPTGRSRALIIGNMFSAGVMVSAGFCHLLGEAVKTMPAMQFSLATFLCGLGYLITLCADKAATMLTGNHSPHCSSGNLDQGVEVIVGVDLAERGVTTPDGRINRPANNNPSGAAVAKERLSFNGNEEVALLRNEQSSSSSPTMAGSFAAARQRRDSAIQGSTAVLNRTNSDITGMMSGSGVELHRGTAGIAGTDIETATAGSGAGITGSGNLLGTNVMVPTSAFELEDGTAYDTHVGGGIGGGGGGGNANGGGGRYQPVGNHHQNLHYGHNHNHHSHHTSGGGGGATVSFITAVLMAVALCFHSLLEGAAMGAQPTIANSLHIFIAIVSHKGLAAYALGSSIAESNVGVRQFWSVALPFTFASPVGIFIGYIISDIAQGVGAAAISALASGTFLYVAFMEVIPRELHSPERIVEKLGALLLGFGLMSLLAIWA